MSEMNRLNVKKFVGLVGVERSGKTHILKGLAEWMLNLPGARLRCAYDNSLNRIDDIAGAKDFMAAIDCCGKTYVVVTFGDVRHIVRGIIGITIEITIEVSVEVFFAAMRSESPNVCDEYRKVLSEYNRNFLIVKKTRFFEKRCPRDKLIEVDRNWIDKFALEICG